LSRLQPPQRRTARQYQSSGRLLSLPMYLTNQAHVAPFRSCTKGRGWGRGTAPVRAGTLSRGTLSLCVISLPNAALIRFRLERCTEQLGGGTETQTPLRLADHPQGNNQSDLTDHPRIKSRVDSEALRCMRPETCSIRNHGVVGGTSICWISFARSNVRRPSGCSRTTRRPNS
jgi:hypothetical protein